MIRNSYLQLRARFGAGAVITGSRSARKVAKLLGCDHSTTLRIVNRVKEKIEIKEGCLSYGDKDLYKDTPGRRRPKILTKD